MSAIQKLGNITSRIFSGKPISITTEISSSLKHLYSGFASGDVMYDISDENRSRVLHRLAIEQTKNRKDSVFDFVSSESGPNGNTILHYSTIMPDALKLLLREGANPNAVNARGETPLIFALDHTPPTSIERAVDALLEHKADVNIQAKNGTNVADMVLNPNVRGESSLQLRLLGKFLNAGLHTGFVHSALSRWDGDNMRGKPFIDPELRASVLLMIDNRRADRNFVSRLRDMAQDFV